MAITKDPIPSTAIKYKDYDSVIQHIKQKGIKVTQKVLPNGISYTILRIKTQDDGKEEVIAYMKYETSRGYLTIGREIPELKGKIGKTLNVDVAEKLKYDYRNPLLIFADPYDIRVMELDIFMQHSHEFIQKVNNELCLAINKFDMIPYNKFFNITVEGQKSKSN